MTARSLCRATLFALNNHGKRRGKQPTCEGCHQLIKALFALIVCIQRRQSSRSVTRAEELPEGEHVRAFQRAIVRRHVGRSCRVLSWFQSRCAVATLVGRL